MRLLIFGRTGQVARELARAMPDDVSATFLDRAQADLSQPERCADIIASTPCDAVINAAAWTDVDGAEDNEAAALVVNALAPGAMAQGAAAKGVPLLHLSTDYVFDGTGDKPWRPDAPTAPLSAYGRTKLAGEVAVRAAGGRHLILRTAWVFSPFGTNFMRTMLRLGVSRPNIDVVADQIGGPTPASAIARALLTAARAMIDGHPGGTHHFSGAPDLSWAGFADAIMEQAGLTCAVNPISTAEFPTKAPRPANSRLDCTSFRDAFGIDRPSWQDALRRMLKEQEAAT